MREKLRAIDHATRQFERLHDRIGESAHCAAARYNFPGASLGADLIAMTRNRLLIAAAAIFVIWLGGNLALHFGQIRHDHLDYDIAQVFPPDKPTVPGE